MENSLLSVVIANYNRQDDLRLALGSVYEQDYEPIEVIVVDNASTDSSCAMLAREFPQVQVIALAENRAMDGYSVGFEQARGEFIFQMDNDSLLQAPDILSQIVKRFEQGPADLSVVATRVEQYDGNPATIESLLARDSRVGPINTGGFPGAAGFRARLLHQVGYYNREVFLYGSEMFLQMKLLAAGFQIFYYPEIVTLHKAAHGARSAQSVYYEVRNRYWFMRRFATRRQQFKYVPAMLLHDAAYTLHKKKPTAFLRAVKDGFAPLPRSLCPPLHSNHPVFQKQIEYVGNEFSLGKLVTRARQKLARAST